MQLLIDTDAFCKLAVGGVLEEAVGFFGLKLADCGRLPALPHMLRRGKLRKMLGERASDALSLRAEEVPVMAQPTDNWLAALTAVDAIDPGEAQLFALAAEAGLIVFSGDKRALRAIKNVPDIMEHLSGKVVVLEAVLIALCDEMGPDVVRERIGPLAAIDTAVRVCFSSGNPRPQDALLSYYRHLQGEIAPVSLWAPPRIEANP